MIKAEYLFLINSFILRERERTPVGKGQRERRESERKNPKLALPC